MNSRPSIYTEPLDLAVNAPLVKELFSIVGFHLPSSGMNQSTLKVGSLISRKVILGFDTSGVVQEVQTKSGYGSHDHIFGGAVHKKSQQRGEQCSLNSEH